LLYDFERPVFPLLLVIANGVRIIVDKMIEIAKEERICVMINVPLMHPLLDMGDVMEYILHELIVSVAEVLC
jgi:flagellar biosynthesis protein FlhB